VPKARAVTSDAAASFMVSSCKETGLGFVVV
jgi:hypothetical protein